MSTPGRPSTWYIWVPLLVVLLVVGLFAVTRSRSVEEAPAGPVASAGVGSSSSGPSGSSRASGSSTPASGLATVAESALPREAAETLRLIRAGGPYPHAADDDVFGNRERLLPRRERGYYREYTVRTPGEDDRGPRRIVAGADGDLYWTTDHYASFRQILEGR